MRAADAGPAAPPGLLMLCSPCRAQVKSVRRRDKKARSECMQTQGAHLIMNVRLVDLSNSALIFH